MKGKKADRDFIASFIMECSQKGSFDVNQIVSLAEQEINEIDEAIKNIELLKKKRCKLLDVVDSFKKNEKFSDADKLTLSFYRVKNLVLAGTICGILTAGGTPDLICDKGWKKEDVLLTVKELCEIKVLMNHDKKVVPGIHFKEFQNFAMKYCRDKYGK